MYRTLRSLKTKFQYHGAVIVHADCSYRAQGCISHLHDRDAQILSGRVVQVYLGHKEVIVTHMKISPSSGTRKRPGGGIRELARPV